MYDHLLAPERRCDLAPPRDRIDGGECAIRLERAARNRTPALCLSVGAMLAVVNPALLVALSMPLAAGVVRHD